MFWIRARCTEKSFSLSNWECTWPLRHPVQADVWCNNSILTELVLEWLIKKIKKTPRTTFSRLRSLGFSRGYPDSARAYLGWTRGHPWPLHTTAVYTYRVQYTGIYHAHGCSWPKPQVRNILCIREVRDPTSDVVRIFRFRKHLKVLMPSWPVNSLPI